jgi:hypothetical protein
MSLQQLHDHWGLMKNKAAIHVNRRTTIPGAALASPA